MVILPALTWIAAIVGMLLLGLLVVPARVRIGGNLDDREGADYRLRLDWALGLIAMEKRAASPWQLTLLGLSATRFLPGKKSRAAKEKKAKKKKASPWARMDFAGSHFRTLVRVVKKITCAVFLKGRLFVRLGLPDPAQTAGMGIVLALLKPSRRFKPNVACVYDEEVVRIHADVQATLILGYLALTAGALLLERQTRMMLQALRHA